MILRKVSALERGPGEALEEALEQLWRDVRAPKHLRAKVAVSQAWRTNCARFSVYAVMPPPGDWSTGRPLTFALAGALVGGPHEDSFFWQITIKLTTGTQ